MSAWFWLSGEESSLGFRLFSAAVLVGSRSNDGLGSGLEGGGGGGALSPTLLQTILSIHNFSSLDIINIADMNYWEEKKKQYRFGSAVVKKKKKMDLSLALKQSWFAVEIRSRIGKWTVLFRFTSWKKMNLAFPSLFLFPKQQATVILHFFGVVLFSVVKGLPKLKRHLNKKKALSDHGSIHRHRNLNYTEHSVIARHWNLDAPKICKITVPFKTETICMHHPNCTKLEPVCGGGWAF